MQDFFFIKAPGHCPDPQPAAESHFQVGLPLPRDGGPRHCADPCRRTVSMISPILSVSTEPNESHTMCAYMSYAVRIARHKIDFMHRYDSSSYQIK